MIEAELSIGILLGACDLPVPPKTKKADVAEHPEGFNHVGLLYDKPPAKDGLPFI